MQVRLIAAAVNGALVLALYLGAWGAPNFTIALLEVGLAVGAGLSTWYALDRVATPAWITRLASQITRRGLAV